MHLAYIMNTFQHEEDKVEFQLFEYLYEEMYEVPMYEEI